MCSAPFSPSRGSSGPPSSRATSSAVRTAAALAVPRALLTVRGEFPPALIMHDIQGLPYDDIALALGIPLGTVKSRLHRGRVALGQALGTTRSRSSRGEPKPRR